MGSQNLKLGHVTWQRSLVTKFCLIELALRGPLLSFKFQLDWTYCLADMTVIRFCRFGWKMRIRAYFEVFGDIDSVKL